MLACFAEGPEGLLKGRKVYLVVARGGVYTEGPMQRFNFQDTYLRTALGLIGLDDVEQITVEGVAFGPKAAGIAVNDALTRVFTIAASTGSRRTHQTSSELAA